MLQDKLSLVALKPLTVIILTVSLIIFGMVVVRSDAYTVSCSCYVPEGETCPPCPNFTRDAVSTAGFIIIAAGAALPVLVLIAAKKKGNMAEISE